jgi:DNA-binding response OmpR family regulator
MAAQTHDIIIAEDDEVLRDLYLRKFKSGNYTLRTASNGEETLRMIAEKKPDMLLLDINMPILDGFGVLAKLAPQDRTFPVIVLTNFDDEQNRSKGAQFNIADYFVKKDMTIKSLVEMVDKQLANRV